MPHVVFLPGASGHTDFWQPIIHHLSTFCTVQVIAYPGFSNCPSHPNVQNFADLSQYVLTKIPTQSIVIAQSMGGIFAVQAALQMPEKIQKLVLIATSGGIDLSPFQVEDWREAYHAQFCDYPTWFSEIDLDYSAQLKQIQQPTLLLWGGQDRISPVEIGQYLQQQIDNAHLDIIELGDHHFAFTYADHVIEKLIPFLAAEINDSTSCP